LYDVGGVIGELGLTSLVLVGLSMGGRNAIYFTSKRPDLVQSSSSSTSAPRSASVPPPRRPALRAETWDSIEQAAQHLYRGNPNPGIHYYRWVVTTSLRQRADGALVWAWHPSVKERRSQLDIDWWAVLKSITPPTLVLRGESSTVLDRDVAERMGKELPRGRFVEIPRAVHTLHEDNPRPSSPRSRVPRLLGLLELQILVRRRVRVTPDQADAGLFEPRPMPHVNASS